MRFNVNDEVYVCNPRSSMKHGRGCFGICYEANFVYVFGGTMGRDLNYIEKQEIKFDEYQI